MILLFCVFMMAAEAAMICAEVLASKGSWYSPPVVSLQLASAIALLVLYNWGLKKIGDIWIVSVASVASVVIAEPIIVYALTRKIPGTYPAIGMLLALLAVCVSSLGGK
jgi:hypothetical protein